MAEKLCDLVKNGGGMRYTHINISGAKGSTTTGTAVNLYNAVVSATNDAIVDVCCRSFLDCFFQIYVNNTNVATLQSPPNNMCVNTVTVVVPKGQTLKVIMTQSTYHASNQLEFARGWLVK